MGSILLRRTQKLDCDLLAGLRRSDRRLCDHIFSPILIWFYLFPCRYGRGNALFPKSPSINNKDTKFEKLTVCRKFLRVIFQHSSIGRQVSGRKDYICAIISSSFHGNQRKALHLIATAAGFFQRSGDKFFIFVLTPRRGYPKIPLIWKPREWQKSGPQNERFHRIFI